MNFFGHELTNFKASQNPTFLEKSQSEFSVVLKRQQGVGNEGCIDHALLGNNFGSYLVQNKVVLLHLIKLEFSAQKLFGALIAKMQMFVYFAGHNTSNRNINLSFHTFIDESNDLAVEILKKGMQIFCVIWNTETLEIQ